MMGDQNEFSDIRCAEHPASDVIALSSQAPEKTAIDDPGQNGSGNEQCDTGPLIIYMNDQSGNKNMEEMRSLIKAELDVAQVPFTYLWPARMVYQRTRARRSS